MYHTPVFEHLWLFATQSPKFETGIGRAGQVE